MGGTGDVRLCIHQPVKKQKCFLDEKELMYILKHGNEIKRLGQYLFTYFSASLFCMGVKLGLAH